MENELVPTRQSIAANMYALRAGLSVVSGEVQKGIRTLDKAAAHLESVKADAQDAIFVAQKTKEFWKQATHESYYKDIALSVVFSLILIAFFGLLAYAVCSFLVVGEVLSSSDEIIIFLYTWLFKINNDYSGMVMIALTLAAVIGIIVFSIYLHRKTSDISYYKRRYCKDVVGYNKKNTYYEMSETPSVRRSEVTPAYVKQKYLEAEALLSHIQNQENKRIAEAEAEYENVIASVKANFIFPAKTMYSVLASIFARMIDERDWENLDYLIYAIETGRAESVKEALQLLDKEKQTDRIIAAIQTASREIAKLLVAGFNALSRQISSDISMLSRQIQANSFHTAQLSARMSQIASAQTLNSALLEKANESSSQLVADVHRIAELENMRYNRGY